MNNIKIYSSYYSNLKKIKEENNINDKYFISISRYLPEWIKKDINEQILELSPSEALLKYYKKNIGKKPENELEKEYAKIFLKEKKESNIGNNFKDLINKIKKLDKKEIYLLCYEKPNEFCHRHIIMKWLKKYIEKFNITGIEIIGEKFFEDIDFSTNYKYLNYKFVNNNNYDNYNNVIIFIDNDFNILSKEMEQVLKRYNIDINKLKKQTKFKVGDVINVNSNNKNIILTSIQKNFDNEFKMRTFKSSLKKLNDYIINNNINNVYIPKIDNKYKNISLQEINNALVDTIKSNIENKIFYYIKNPDIKIKLEENKIFRENPGMEFLSNMYYAPIKWKGYTFPSSENIYQFEKLPEELKEKYINKYINAKPSEAKKLGRKNPLRKDWDGIKIKIMFEILKEKFNQHPELKEKLKKIEGDIVEYNYWRDTFWGYDYNLKKGKNYLGKLLMLLRDAYINNEEPKLENLKKFEINNKIKKNLTIK